VRREDEPAMLAFLRGLSEESRLLRFFSAGADLVGQARRFTQADGSEAYGLIATVGGGGEIVGHAGYVRVNGGHGRGGVCDRRPAPGSRPRDRAARPPRHARPRQGIETFTAVVRPDNHRMIEVFRESGFPVEVHVALTSSALPCD